MNKKLIYAVLPFAVIFVVSISPLLCASTITPKDVNVLTGFSVNFTFKDPNYASATLGYKVLDSTGAVIETGTFTTDANGEGQFSVTFNDAGEFKVQVYETVNNTVLATAYVHVLDIIGLIMPILIIIITLSVVFGIADAIIKEIKIS